MKGATLEKSETKKQELKKKRDFHLPFANLKREMNRLFDEFFHGDEQTFQAWPAFETDFQAKVDVTDNNGELVVTAELPGVKLEDIDVTVNSSFLRIEGEKREEKEEKEKGKYRLERSYGSFMRQIPLPCEVEKDQVHASYKDGVLRISLPKSKASIEDEKKVEVRKG